MTKRSKSNKKSIRNKIIKAKAEHQFVNATSKSEPATYNLLRIGGYKKKITGENADPDYVYDMENHVAGNKTDVKHLLKRLKLVVDEKNFVDSSNYDDNTRFKKALNRDKVSRPVRGEPSKEVKDANDTLMLIINTHTVDKNNKKHNMGAISVNLGKSKGGNRRRGGKKGRKPSKKPKKPSKKDGDDDSTSGSGSSSSSASGSSSSSSSSSGSSSGSSSESESEDDKKKKKNNKKLEEKKNQKEKEEKAEKSKSREKKERNKKREEEKEEEE